jgi:hypothetical protein
MLLTPVRTAKANQFVSPRSNLSHILQPANAFFRVNNPPVWQQAFYVALLLLRVHTGHSTLPRQGIR